MGTKGTLQRAGPIDLGYNPVPIPSFSECALHTSTHSELSVGSKVEMGYSLFPMVQKL
jgi:hypothetical protein